jgi:beta-phosphoglucomutase
VRRRIIVYVHAGRTGRQLPGRDDIMRAVLWDLDGTLVDSAEYHWRAWVLTMGAVGMRPTRAQFEASFGQRNDDILTGWLGLEVPRDEIARLGDQKEETYRRLMREEGLVPLPGAAQWVTRLASADWKQAIASSAPRANVEAVLDVLGWRSRFEGIVSAEDVRVGKPEPDVFLAGAERLGVPPSQCVVVEDADAGVEAAHRAGMRCVGVGSRATRADLVVATLADLPDRAFDSLLERRHERATRRDVPLEDA